MQMIFGWKFYIWLVVAGVVIILTEIIVPYKKYANILKWLALSLLVYVVTAFMVKQDWGQIALYTFIPHINFDLAYIMTMIGFLGTTISPYLFFWQASEEVEEEIAEGEIKDFNIHPDTTRGEIKKIGF